MSDNNDNQQPGNDGNSNHTPRRKKKRRKFEAIVPDLQPFPKKVRLSETLLSSSDELKINFSYIITKSKKIRYILYVMLFLTLLCGFGSIAKSFKILILQDRRYVI